MIWSMEQGVKKLGILQFNNKKKKKIKVLFHCVHPTLLDLDLSLWVKKFYDLLFSFAAHESFSDAVRLNTSFPESESGSRQK